MATAVDFMGLKNELPATRNKGAARADLYGTNANPATNCQSSHKQNYSHNQNFSQNMNPNLNYSFHKKNESKVKKCNGGIRSGSSSRRASFTDAYDTELSSDVESVIHPFLRPSQKSASNHVGASRFNTLKYFTLVVVLFPSVIAVAVPSGDVDTSTGDFIANAITDALMIVIVSWSVKTAVEWPWDWLSQLQETRQRLINHVNSRIIGSTDELNYESAIHEEATMASIRMLKKVMSYEKLAMLSSLVLSMFASILMVWTRNHVILDDSRRKLVFSDLNIGLFQFWSVFRIIHQVIENLQRVSMDLDSNAFSKNGSVDNAAGAVSPSVEYGLVTESNLDLFLPSKPHRHDSTLVHTVKNSFEKLFFFINFSLNASHDDYKSHQEQLNSVIRANNEESNRIITQLENSSEEQKTMIEKLSEVQQAEFANISSNFTKLERALVEISKVRQKEKDMKFVKPFPLNFSSPSTSPHDESFTENLSPLSIESAKLAKVNGVKKSPMQTIFEAEHESSPDVESIPAKDISQDMNSLAVQDDSMDPRKAFHKTESYDLRDRNFSLHGLPFSSTIKHIITRKFYPSQDQPQGELDPDVGYESEQIVSDFRLAMGSVSENNTTVLQRTKHFIKVLRHEVTLAEIMRNPMIIGYIFEDRIVPAMQRQMQMNYDEYFRRVEFIKVIIFEIMNKYIFLNFSAIMAWMDRFNEIYMDPIRHTKSFLLLVFTKLPMSILGLYFSVMFFVPKIFIKIFLLNPLIYVVYLVVGDTNDTVKNHRITGSIPRSKGSFQGMKKFHLPSGKSSFQSDGRRQNRTREVLLQKLVQRYDLDSTENMYQENTPVLLYSEKEN